MSPSGSSPSCHANPCFGRSGSSFGSSEKKYEESHFTKWIDDCAIPEAFWKLPKLRRYDCTGDPHQHLARYRLVMHDKNVEELIICKVFPYTLENWALSWFKDLESGSIFSWGQLLRLFLTFFGRSRPKVDLGEILRNVNKYPFETLRKYLERFNEEARSVGNLDWKEKLFWIRRGLAKGTLFREEITLNHLWTFKGLFSKAREFMHYEEMNLGHHGPPSEDETKRQREVGRLDKDGFTRHTPLTKSRVQIMRECDGRYFKYVERPDLRQWERIARSKKWCQYHHSRGHDSNCCQALRGEIEHLIQQGELQEYLFKRGAPPISRPGRKPHGKRPRPSQKKKVRSEQEAKAYNDRLKESYGGYTSESSDEELGAEGDASMTKCEFCCGHRRGKGGTKFVCKPHPLNFAKPADEGTSHPAYNIS